MEQKNIQAHDGWINAMAVTPDSRYLVSAGDDNTIRLWRVEDGVCIRAFTGHSHWVRAVIVMPDGRRILSGSMDNTLKLWNLQTGDCLRTFKGHGRGVTAIALSADGSRVVSGGGDCDIRYWNVQSGECLRILEGHPSGMDRDGLNSLIRKTNAEIGYSDFLGDLQYSRTYRTEPLRFFGHGDPVTALGITGDGKFIVSGSADNTLRLWRVETGECIWIFGCKSGGVVSPIEALAITADEKFVITAGSGLQYWRLRRKRICRLLWLLLKELPRRNYDGEGIFYDIAVTADRKYMAVVEESGRRIAIRILGTGKLCHIIDISPTPANVVAVSPDGKFIGAGGISGVICIREVPE